MEAASAFNVPEPLRRGVSGKAGRINSDPDKIQAWIEEQKAGGLDATKGSEATNDADYSRSLEQGRIARVTRPPQLKEHSRRSEQGMRPIPGELLQGLRGPISSAEKPTESQDVILASKMLTLSGDLDHSISFGDVREYLGAEASKCAIRRQKQEFFLRFKSTESARSCFAAVALDTSDASLPSGTYPCKPLVKPGKQRSVYISIVPREESTPASLSSSITSGSGQELQASNQLHSAKHSQTLSNSEHRGEHLGATLGPSEEQRSAPSTCVVQQMDDSCTLDNPSSVLLPISLEQKSKSSVRSDFPKHEDRLSLDDPSSEPQPISPERRSKTSLKSDLDKHEDILHELLAQETLRLLAEKAHFQRDAQEKGRQVDRLQRQVDLLLEELDFVHSRLNESESLVYEELRPPQIQLSEPQPSEDGRRKRKKSGTALSPAKLESAPPVASGDSGAKSTGWDVKTQSGEETKAAAMDAAPSGWGGPSGSPNTPPESESAKRSSSSSVQSPKNRGKRGAKNKGGRKVAGYPDQEASVSSEAVERQGSRSSSTSGFWEAPSPYSKEHRDNSSSRAAPQWDAQSTASSLGEGGTRTPSLREGEWEWPASPRDQIQTGTSAPGANQQGKSAQLDLYRGTEKGLLPLPGDAFLDNNRAEKKSHRVKRFEAGSPLSGREKDARAKKKNAGSRKEGDYAGAPRERVGPGGKWPRGMVT